MKILSTILLSLVSLYLLNAQTQNNTGLYIDSDGGLFNGTIQKNTNNIKSTFTIKEGELEGEATYFYASGKVMEQGIYVKGKKNEKWTRYDETGKIMAVAFYTFGKKTGAWIIFDEMGNKRFEMNYIDGEKTGIWISRDSSGLIESTKDYTRVN